MSDDPKRTAWDHSVCTACGKCVPVCRADARAIAGTPRTVDEIVRICVSDRMFYEESGGGVTLSGGEVMMQNTEFLLTLLRALKNEDISVNIDTCGYVAFEKLKAVAPYVDTFLYDIKSADTKKHRNCTGVGGELIISNLHRLSDSGAKIDIRIPVMAPADKNDAFDGANFTDEDINGIIKILRDTKYRRVCLLPYHNTGEYKRASLGYESTGRFATPSPNDLERIKTRLTSAGITPVVIGG